MMMNLLLVAFILAMVYWWALQGLFSSMLHLMVVILAGSLAFAVWETLVMTTLIHQMPAMAWGVGLLAPFVLFVIALRVILEKLAPRNVFFFDIANKVGGGLFGLFSGILVAGFTLIGIGFMPLPASVLGYQPYVVIDGRVAPNPESSLWLSVDRWAGGFYAGLSAGPFAPI
ncbi:MAG: hypothetical protein R3336_10605, partial [Phycisphaeraceae bacterium]|nr:hypothetical protein [Phycisphaeraceae bacterium]